MKSAALLLLLVGLSFGSELQFPKAADICLILEGCESTVLIMYECSAAMNHFRDRPCEGVQHVCSETVIDHVRSLTCSDTARQEFELQCKIVNTYPECTFPEVATSENFLQNFLRQRFPSRPNLSPSDLSSRLSLLNQRTEGEGIFRLCRRLTGMARTLCTLRFRGVGESQPRPSQLRPAILPGRGSKAQLIRTILNRIRGGGRGPSVTPTTEGPQTSPSSPAPAVGTDLPPQDREDQDMLSELIDIINRIEEGEGSQRETPSTEAPTTEAPTTGSQEAEELSEEEALQELEKVLSGIN